MLNKKTVDDLKDLNGKKVLVRCDFNVPLKDGVIQNYNRIDGAIPTIKKLLDQGAKVILCSHLGKPKGEPLPEMSLAPVAPALSERLGTTVKFVSDPKVTGDETKKLAAELKDGEVLLLENTRYRGEETKYGKEPAAEEYAKELAALCDDGIFVNDAFGTAHRAHCSNVGVTKYCKENVVGYLMEKEQSLTRRKRYLHMSLLSWFMVKRKQRRLTRAVRHFLQAELPVRISLPTSLKTATLRMAL